MDYETIKMEKLEKVIGEYMEKYSTDPPKIAVMSCEGACARGDIARRAANLVAHNLARDETVRICLGGAFNMDTGPRDLITRADKTIAIEGCPSCCSTNMMKKVLPNFQPEIVQADMLHKSLLPFGIDEVPEDELKKNASIVAEAVVKKYIK